MTKNENKEYQVQAVIKNIVSVSIRAATLGEAMEKAQRLIESDFVEIKGENIDSGFRISGVYESSLE